MDRSLHQQFADIEWSHWWFCARRAILADVLGQRLDRAKSDGRRLLDVGCGAGAMIAVLERFGSVQGFDLSPESIEYCRNRFPASRFAVGAIPDVLAQVEPVDVACAFDVIEHIEDSVGALRAMRAALRPDGLLLCTVPAYQWLWGPHDDLNGHRRRYTATLLRKELEASGFRVDYLTYFNTLLLLPIAAVRLARQHILRREPSSDFVLPRPGKNRLLTWLMAMERFPLRHTSLPAGVSLLAVATPAATG